MPFKPHNHYKFSVTWLPVDPTWRALRRILNSNILSLTKLDANQQLRSQKVQQLVDYVAKCCQEGEVVVIGKAAFKTSLNLLSNILFSKDLVDPFLDSKDIFTGGTDTTTSTVEWAMTEILKQPEIMKKAQAELTKIVGMGKIIEEADVFRLPYLHCIVKETLRMHPPVPFLLPRKVEEDVEVCGYIVPKGSQVLVNVWAIGRDPASWEDPLVFKPERFLNLEVDVRGKDFELIPFGAGRRICPGLPLAALRMVPVMLGSLLNSFNWKLEEGTSSTPKELDMEEKFGITLAQARPLRAIPSPI